jgi:glycosyltransferase involved in cell wall biosynthesis
MRLQSERGQRARRGDTPPNYPGKVCILTSVHPPLDARIFEREAKTLALAGYQVVLMAAHDTTNENRDGILIKSLPKPSRRLGRVLNWPRFLKRGLQERADIYHIHDPDLLPMALVLRVLTRRPLIYDCHEHYPEEILTREWLPSLVRPIVAHLFDWFERIVATALSAVVGVEDSQLRRFPRATLLYNFPAAASFKSLPDTPLEPGLLLYAGSLTATYGIWQLVEMMKYLSDLPVRLVILGRFDLPVTQSRFLAQVARDAPDRIQWKGRVPFSVVCEWLGRASIGLMPNQSYGSNRFIHSKLFEYMAAGLPVIASDLPLNRLFVESAECGLLVPPSDAAGYAQAVRYLLEHPDQARQMGQNGQKAFRERYNWETQSPKLLELYERLLA